MLRRLYPDQPESFAFTPANRAWAEAQIAKFPEGRQASAVIALLWRAQEQEGWLTRPAIEHVADMLGMARIRALEVATFYFMFQLQPVGSVAHIQVCGTTSCMICGAEDLIGVCRERIAPEAHMLSPDGKFSWEEVECLGACANAPMAQIGKDYYEDLTTERLAGIIDALDRGEVPRPGPQNGRFASEPAGGAHTLGIGRMAANASVTLALEIGDTVRRIDGTEVPLRTPWRKTDEAVPEKRDDDLPGVGLSAGEATPGPQPSKGQPVDETGTTVQEARAVKAGRPAPSDAAPGTAERADVPAAELSGADPAGEGPDEARGAGGPARRAPLVAPDGNPADDLTRIAGIGPVINRQLNEIGVYRFAQIAAWGEAEIDRIDEMVGGPEDRVRRDRWVEQARAFASEGETS